MSKSKDNSKILNYNYDGDPFWEKYVVSYENQIFDMAAVQRGFAAIVDANRRGPYGDQKTNAMMDRVRKVVIAVANERFSGINWSAMGMSSRIAHLRRKEGAWTDDDVCGVVGGLFLMMHYYYPMSKKWTHTLSDPDKGLHLPKMLQGAMKDVLRMQWTKPFGNRTKELKIDGNYRSVRQFYELQRQDHPEPFWVTSTHKLMQPVDKAVTDIINCGFPIEIAGASISPGVIVRGGGLMIEAVVPFDSNKERFLYGSRIKGRYQVALVTAEKEFDRDRQPNRFAGRIEMGGIAAYQMATGPSSAGGGRRIKGENWTDQEIEDASTDVYKELNLLMSEYDVLKGLPTGYDDRGVLCALNAQAGRIHIHPVRGAFCDKDKAYISVQAYEGDDERLTAAKMPEQFIQRAKKAVKKYAAVRIPWRRMVEKRYKGEVAYASKWQPTFAHAIEEGTGVKVDPESWEKEGRSDDYVIEVGQKQGGEVAKEIVKKNNDNLF